MIKRTLFRNMASGTSNSVSRARNSNRRAGTFKAPTKNQFLRPGTPYPKPIGDSASTSRGNSVRFASTGGEPQSHPIPDAASSNSFATVASASHGNMLAAENVRLRREVPVGHVTRPVREASIEIARSTLWKPPRGLVQKRACQKQRIAWIMQWLSRQGLYERWYCI